MREQQRVAGLGDEALLAGLVAIVGREDRITCELLAYLGEVDERRLYAERGFDSMWRFCTESLGVCESTAGRRLAAARACRLYPEAFAMIASGAVKVVALALMWPHLKPENAAELVAVCSRKSLRQVEELLAARFPKPDVKDSVRRLPERKPTSSAGGASEATSESRSTSSELPCESVLKPASGPVRPVVQRRIEPLSEGRYGVHFTADTAFRDLLTRVRGLASHRVPSGDLKTVLQRGLEAYERELLKGRFAVGAKPRASRAARVTTGAKARALRDSRSTLETKARTSRDSRIAVKPTPEVAPRQEPSRKPSLTAFRRLKRARALKRSRVVPAATLRELYERDGGRCAFVSEDGHRCGARQFLQVDHVIPFAWGGGAATPQLRLLCRAHNLLHARRCFGATLMRVAVGRARHESASQ